MTKIRRTTESRTTLNFLSSHFSNEVEVLDKNEEEPHYDTKEQAFDPKAQEEKDEEVYQPDYSEISTKPVEEDTTFTVQEVVDDDSTIVKKIPVEEENEE